MGESSVTAVLSNEYANEHRAKDFPCCITLIVYTLRLLLDNKTLRYGEFARMIFIHS